MSFCQIQLIGNLGRDPEMNYTPDGVPVTKFSLAVTKKQKGKEDVTTWYNAVAWRQAAETLNAYLHKGDPVFIQGELNPRQYTTKDGRSGFSLDVIVDRFSFVGGKKNAGGSEIPGTGDQDDSDPLGNLEDHPF